MTGFYLTKVIERTEAGTMNALLCSVNSAYLMHVNKMEVLLLAVIQRKCK